MGVKRTEAGAQAEEIGALRAVSILLRYPSTETRDFAQAVAAGEIRIRGGRRDRRRVEDFCAWYGSAELSRLQEDYVEAIDFNRGASLHLTYHLHGDSRQRGLALVRIKRGYAAAGFEAAAEELPDYLPLMLEFAALEGSDRGIEPLTANREAIEIIRRTLAESESRLTPLIEVVAAALPRLTTRQERRVLRLAEEGPPTEQVGLEPFSAEHETAFSERGAA